MNNLASEVDGMETPTGGRVLVLSDKPLIADTIALTLNHGRFDIKILTGADDANKTMTTWKPHVAILDMDSLTDELSSSIGLGKAEQPPSIPVIGLTRRGDLQSKLNAFDIGFDDIMTVPFSPEELLARTVAIFRRTYKSLPTSMTPLRIGELQIDIVNREVRAGDSVIHLSGLEQSLLYLLAANSGRVIGRDEIIDALWGPDFVSESNIVDRHIRSLRAKLQNDWRQPRFIATVHGRGYRFIPTFSSDSL